MKRILKTLVICILACCLCIMVSCGVKKDTDEKTNTKTQTSTQTSTDTGDKTDTDTDTSTSTDTSTDTNTDTSTDTDTGTCKHEWRNIPRLEPTCTLVGKTEGAACINCGEYLVKPEQIPALGHEKEIVPEIPATCENTGLTRSVDCTRCGHCFEKQEVIPALGHTPEILPGKDAICDETGLTDGEWCSVCKKILKEQLPVFGGHHSYDYHGACQNCDKKLGEAIIIVADISSSMKELVATGETRFSALRDTIADFIIGLEEYDYIGVIAFDQNSHMILEMQEVGDEENREALSKEVVYLLNHNYYCHYIDKETGEESDIRINFSKDGVPNYDNIYVDGNDAKYILPEDYNRGGQDKVTGDFIKSYGTAYSPAMQATDNMYNSFDDIGIEVISKKVVFISDGAPNDKPEGKYVNLASAMAKSGISIDTVCLGLDTESMYNELKRIADAGNGEVEEAVDKETLLEAILASYRKANINGVLDEIGDYTFLVAEDDNVYLMSYEGNEKNMVFPESYKGKEYYIYNLSSLINSNIESIVINGKTTIQNREFYGCTTLKSVTLGKGVTYIGQYAFYGCTSLTNVVIGDDVISIGGRAFEGCIALTNVVIGNNVASIEDYAFYDCQSLLSITIGKGLSSLSNYVFSTPKLAEIYNLSSINIGTAAKPGNITFHSVLKIHNSLDEESILKTTEDGYVFAVAGEDDIYLVAYTGDKTELVLPETYNGKSYIINRYAFASFSNRYGVSGGNNITKITLPKTIKEIGASAFNGCTSLKEVHISDLESWCDISFANNSSTPLCCGAGLYVNGEHITNLVIPSTVKEIKNYAFGYGDFESVTISEGVTNIGAEAFYNCKSLEEIKLPTTLEVLGVEAFYGCTSLVSLEIPNSITSIGNYAFKGCTSLKDVTIPSSVTNIGDYAFEGCSSLVSIELSNTITSIGFCAFRNCSSIKSIIIPSSVTSIDNYAFENCTALLEVYNLSELEMSIGATTNGYVTYYAKAIHTSLDEESVFQSIGDFAFVVVDDDVYLAGYTGKETELVLPESFEGKTYIIMASAFKGRTDIIKVTITGGVTAIEDRAFYGCTSLETVLLSNTIERIEGESFAGCSALEYNTYFDGKYLGSEDNPYLALISINTQATSITIQAETKIILENAFANASSLEELTLLAGAKITIPSGIWKAGDIKYYAGDTVVATEDITLACVYSGDCQLVSNQVELLDAIKNQKTPVLKNDIYMATYISGYNYSIPWGITDIYLNGYNITFASSLLYCSNGQRYGLNIMGKGTITYEGTGVFAVMNNHPWGGQCCILTIGKDVKINAPNATLVRDSSASYVDGYPMIEIYGKVICNNLINISSTGNRNPRVEIYDGAELTLNGSISAHSVVGNTTYVNISGGTIIANNAEESFFDEASIYAITGGKFYFACEGDSEKLATIIDTEAYKVVESTEGTMTYYTVEANSDFGMSMDFGVLEQ